MTPPVPHSLLWIVHFDGKQLVGHWPTCLDVYKEHGNDEMRGERQVVGPDCVASLFSICNDLRESGLVVRQIRLHLIQSGSAS